MATETRDPKPKDNGAPPGGAHIPKLSEGIELIGEYEGSGFKEAPYIARRGDGQVIQISHLLHSVAENSDGERNFGQVAERVSDDIGRKVSRDNVRRSPTSSWWGAVVPCASRRRAGGGWRRSVASSRGSDGLASRPRS